MEKKLIRRIEGPTPNGGEYAEISFTDRKGKPCEEKDAYRFTINEYDKEGTVINSTYGFSKKK